MIETGHCEEQEPAKRLETDAGESGRGHLESFAEKMYREESAFSDYRWDFRN